VEALRPVGRVAELGSLGRFARAMLTLDKLKMYRQFNGDIDGLARARIDDLSGAIYEDWRLIDELRQALFLVSSGRATLEFAASVEQRLTSVARRF
jgi:hypothetical protein